MTEIAKKYGFEELSKKAHDEQRDKFFKAEVLKAVYIALERLQRDFDELEVEKFYPERAWMKRVALKDIENAIEKFQGLKEKLEKELDEA